ncbi:M20/M25/M40 family metallo-hydrolase [Carboxydochorda subterranea]|uniref:M20/M25/M40 family metallo-hydrolase n=1 Tax=Carboxydichorda subterranea TaxID=3109565 RepID=A0ABZ1BYN0_9FIRM|nr:M20/M25/M40 family metallo-hydrolase [Limnochorda sp. L945t]WRP17596.1 M20/M25/M40 family metallo-hydrolase [Limnochorda sp. L945t]
MNVPASSTPSSGVEKVVQHLRARFDEDLEQVRAFLRTPSVSYTGQGIQETARQVAGFIRGLGGTASVVPTAGHPIVFGRLDQQAAHTVLVYGMYDVMPADEPNWSSDPWAAEIRDLPGLGLSVIARGAVNTKGPLAAFFRAVEAYRHVAGRLPVNLLFAIEGEEEMGSRHFLPFVESHREELGAADAVLFPFFSQDEAGVPSLTLGTKGILYFELECRGGDWGGPTERGIHGSNNAWVANPVWRLVQALATLVDEEENPKVEGFLDGVTPLDPAEREILRRQVESGLMDERPFMQFEHVRRFKGGLRGVPLWERLFGQPQFNIDGLVGGYVEEGTKTLLPHRALAKLDVRTVPRMDPDAVAAAIRRHLDAHGYADIEMRVLNNYPWSKVRLDEPAVQAMVETYQTMGRTPQIWPLNPGSAPYYVFERVLGIPYVTGGLGHGGRQHSTDEYCTVQGILDFEISMVRWMDAFSRRMDERKR